MHSDGRLLTLSRNGLSPLIVPQNIPSGVLIVVPFGNVIGKTGPYEGTCIAAVIAPPRETAIASIPHRAIIVSLVEGREEWPLEDRFAYHDGVYTAEDDVGAVICNTVPWHLIAKALNQKSRGIAALMSVQRNNKAYTAVKNVIQGDLDLNKDIDFEDASPAAVMYCARRWNKWNESKLTNIQRWAELEEGHDKDAFNRMSSALQENKCKRLFKVLKQQYGLSNGVHYECDAAFNGLLECLELAWKVYLHDAVK